MRAILKKVIKKLLQLERSQQRPVPSSFEEQLYAALVRRGDVCFDVGANKGDVSLFLARLVGESGNVVAFEPVWPVYIELCRSLQNDTCVKAPVVTVPVGLSDTDSHAMVHVPNGCTGMGSMADAVEWERAQSGAAIASYSARFTSLDSFLLTSGIKPPVFMKIDVEGAELFVLRGANELLSDGPYPLMLIEVFAPWEKAFGYRPWQPLSWLMERGYRFLFACPNGLVEHLPTEASPFPPEYEMGYNLLAYRPDSHGDRIGEVDYLRAGRGGTRLAMPPPPQPNRGF
ncbi:MAG: FkbM family methyltransferase [Isosphaeraceae bacterium]